MDLFLRKKPSKLIICLKAIDKDWTLSQLSKESDMTYVYLMKLIPKLKQLDLILVEKKGKRKILKLTKKGLELATLLEQIEGLN